MNAAKKNNEQLILSEIWIYPIKSLGGIKLKEARVQKKGLQNDRRWMLVDGDGVAMTQREYPLMALFKPLIQGEVMSVTYNRRGETISSASFDMNASRSGTYLTARVWDDEVVVTEVDSDLSRWFSHHLNMACRLVCFPEENPRPVDPRYSIGQQNVSLADAYPFLLIGQSSLNDLNSRLAHPVPMNRFRPNFVFAGGQPYSEDNWENFSIGQVSFAAVKKCDRCVLTTVDQDSAERGAEPLRTLSAYRKIDNKVYFGQNLVALSEGEVALGDPVIPV